MRTIKYRASVVLSFLLFLCIILTPSPDKINGSVISPTEVRVIYNNLWKYSGLGGAYKPEFKIVESAEINAYQMEDLIVIYTGMIKFSNDRDEIAGVLAHEIAHYLLEHQALNPTGGKDHQTILEGNADKFSIYLMLRAGYNVCKIQNLWRHLRDVDGDYEVNSDHPNYSYRIWQFQFPTCGEQV